MNTFSERVRNRRKELGLSQIELAKKAGLSQTTISDIERGRNDGSRDIVDLARALQCSPEHLVNGAPIDSNINLGLKLYPDRRGYPIISAIQAGNWREIVDSFPRGGADEYIMASNTYGKHTFALRITGNSMEPEFKEGDVVVIDPDVMPSPGDCVVARNHVEAATFKKYRPRGIIDGQEVFELVPLNEDYAIMRSDQQPIQIIGTMMEHTRYRR
jgi:SOS-response transcriptional repressor LexA